MILILQDKILQKKLLKCVNKKENNQMNIQKIKTKNKCREFKEINKDHYLLNKLNQFILSHLLEFILFKNVLTQMNQEFIKFSIFMIKQINW